MENKLNKLEVAGLGESPFMFIGAVEIPVCDDKNIQAYERGMQIVAQASKKFGIGFGTCSHCGMGIRHNYVVRSSDGIFSTLGCECVKHIDTPEITDKVKRLEARRRNAMAKAKRDAKAKAKRDAYQAWLQEIDPSTGETNEAKKLRENQEFHQAQIEARNEAKKKTMDACKAKFPEVYESLKFAQNHFANSLLSQLAENGSLSYRQAECAMKFCFPTGRRNKGNAVQWDSLLDSITRE